jgi:hypothetical protein
MKSVRKDGFNSFLFVFNETGKIAYPKQALIVLVLAVTMLPLFAKAAIACCKPKKPKKIETIIIFGPDEGSTIEGKPARFQVSGYETFAAPGGTHCALALGHSGNLITTVRSGSVVLAGTFTALQNFGPFATDQVVNQNITTGFGFTGGATVGGLTGQGFLATVNVNQPINFDPPIPLDLVFDVTVRPGTTAQALAADLLASALIGTAEADASGHLNNPDHFSKDRIDSVTVASVTGVPTLSEWGVMIMALLLLSAGTLLITKGLPVMVEVALGGSGVSPRVIVKPLFVPRVLCKVLAVMLALVLLGFSATVWLFGSISATDIGGSLLCTMIIAYIVHLVIAVAKDPKVNRR